LRLLLDTHTLIWWYLDRDELSPTAAAVLRDEANVAMVSAASIFEIAVKHRIGKLPQVAELINDLDALLEDQMFGALPITIQHARTAGLLAGQHRDPFDRMLAAQAIVENLVLISNDAALDQFGVQRLW
jgi:PIN domain nuclease of toxin-antitoxin system